MAWEKRPGGTRYYYKSVRKGDRVSRVYLGSGAAAKREAAAIAKRRTLQNHLRLEQQRLSEGEQLLRDHRKSTRDMVTCLMASVGFLNPKGRKWRKVRMGRRKNIPEPGFFNTPEDPPVENGPPPPRSADEIIRAAQRGDRSVVPELRKLLAKNPEIMGGIGDIAMATRLYWIGAIAGNDFFQFECFLYRAEHLKRRLLAETNGTVVEEMLVDLVVNEWLQMAYHQQRVALAGGKGIEVIELTLKKLTASFNRYTKSLGALTTLQQVKFTQAMKQAMVEIASLRYDPRARPPADDGSDSKSAA